MAMLRWAYTDELELSEDDAFLIDLMKLANRFQLQLLRERSVQGQWLQCYCGTAFYKAIGYKWLHSLCYI